MVDSLFSFSFSSALKLWHGSPKIQCASKKRVSFQFIQQFNPKWTQLIQCSRVIIPCEYVSPKKKSPCPNPLLRHLYALAAWLSVGFIPYISCPFCLQELCLQATTTTTHQECISPCRCFYHSSGLCSKPAWCLMSSQSSAWAWPTR